MRIDAWLKQTWIWLFLIAGIGYIAYYFHVLAPHATLPNTLKPGYLLLAATLQVANFMSSAQLWRGVLSTVSTRRLTILHSLTQFALMGIGKYMPGKIWGMIARAAHGQNHGIDGKVSLLATYYEQAMVLHAAALICAAMISWLYQQYWLATAGAASLFLGPILLTWVRRALVWLAHRIRRMQSPPSLDRLPLWSYLSLTLGYAGIWLMTGVLVAAIYLACFERPLTAEMYATLTLANTAGTTAGFMALFAPGGIGVREAVTSTLLLHNMSLIDAALLSVVYRLWLVAWDLIFGGLFVFYQTYTRRT